MVQVSQVRDVLMDGRDVLLDSSDGIEEGRGAGLLHLVGVSLQRLSDEQLTCQAEHLPGANRLFCRVAFLDFSREERRFYTRAKNSD